MTAVSDIINDINKFVDAFVWPVINDLKKIFNGTSNDKIGMTCKKCKKSKTVTYHKNTKPGHVVKIPGKKYHNMIPFDFFWFLF